MLVDRFMFEEQMAYTFEEVCHELVSYTGGGDYPPFNNNAIKEILQEMDYLDYLHPTANPYSLSFLSLEEVETDVFVLNPTELSIALFNKLDSRYRKHFAVIGKELPLLSSNAEFYEMCKDFFTKVINKLDYTYSRYERLLHFYEEEKTHLLDRLSRSRSGSREVSQEGEHSDNTNNLSIFNDTPQTSDIVATLLGAQHATELNKGNVENEGSSSSSGSDEFEENELFDTMTIMAKLDEVEKHYSNIWQKWLNEFDELFIEEVNY